MSKHVAIIVGSLREGSYNRKLAQALVGLAPDGLEFTFVGTGALPLYNPDLDEGTPPEAWTQFRKCLSRADAVLFVTPEYNRSVPASLKNALDVGSRPYGASVWDGKPTAIVTGSPGGIAGFGANHHLRQSLVFLNAPPMHQPEAYVGNITEVLDEDGNIINDGTRDFLRSVMDGFAAWIDKLSSAS
ncbi:MAG: NAD(P)H-dependent oxidoreductase [Rhodobacteraceae bacterium]|uniref:NAD(P)H-dependent FMN reductase n=1 Tax=Salipiger thiooxidans TaxID=282683 RepID=A0A1G7GT69_9RHOB|nr:NADPH-dependent FMN reductase [Salipiger thiooxidans]MAU45354.1 NAD(P)H-dependent oxidoreductase [Salipiger sp.]NVK58526.1 NAD(P)H-dependent oxidoreductase [Paracoccaceae bacterium]SDE91368.1 NAD(P)H-dependent FMN reductase [Salipiger thiooxidans]